jgi:hypothetical protein
MTNVNGANTLLQEVSDTLESDNGVTRAHCCATTSKSEAIHEGSAVSGQRKEGYRKTRPASLEVIHDNAKELLFVA